MLGAHVTETAGDHDGFVISPDAIAGLGFKGSEVAREIGPTELIVKRRRTDRALGHDAQGRDNSAWATIAQFPRARLVWQLQMGDREPHQPDLGTRATSHRAFVTNFTSRTGTCARKGRDRRRVIVGLHFHQEMYGLVVESPDLIGDVGIEPSCPVACDDGGVIGVGGQHIIATDFMGMTDHRKQGVILLRAVDFPAGIKDFVAAMLRVRLREHHQLDVPGVTPQRGECVDEVADLVFRQRQTQFSVSSVQGQSAAAQQVNFVIGSGR